MYQGNLRGVGQIHQALYDYWQKKASSYYVSDVFGRRIVEAFIQKLKPPSLVEAGCGSGELFSIYKDVPLVLGIDWSSEMLKRSEQRIERHGYKNIQLQQTDLGLPLQNVERRFNVALTRTFLMHMDPGHVEEACRNLTLLSDNILAFEFYKPDVDRLDWHNWHHEYPAIFKQLGYTLVESYMRPDGIPQILFHFVSEVAKK